MFSAIATPMHEAAELFRTSMDALIANGSAQPMIVVLPNGTNKYMGGFYANSSTTGNWDDYITRDVAGYIDSHYRWRRQNIAESQDIQWADTEP